MTSSEFVEANTKYSATFEKQPIRAKNPLIITCMDPRVQPYDQLGVKIGEGGIVRNAGGSAQEAINSIVVAQHFFGTTEIAVFHHTDCGMTKFTTEWLRDTVKKANPGRDDVARTVDGMDFHHITNVEESVHADVKFLVENPLVKKGSKITGWVYNVDTGKINQVADVLV
ncbi:carbonic anhydrase [Mycena rosella]|uniref:Carbonic anhydrase n=1 Tax=Mycena rosella TaxID=1033263 RepID=A0AAD7GKR3_MYCRO|nr:carbonic anhydrase [Mycena rosella]